MNNWSKAGMTGGAIFTLVSFIRYFAIHPDMDKAIVYTLVGITIMACAWLYGEVKKLEGQFDYFEDSFQEHLESLKGGRK